MKSCCRRWPEMKMSTGNRHETTGYQSPPRPPSRRFASLISGVGDYYYNQFSMDRSTLECVLFGLDNGATLVSGNDPLHGADGYTNMNRWGREMLGGLTCIVGGWHARWRHCRCSVDRLGSVAGWGGRLDRDRWMDWDRGAGVGPALSDEQRDRWGAVRFVEPRSEGAGER